RMPVLIRCGSPWPSMAPLLETFRPDHAAPRRQRKHPPLSKSRMTVSKPKVIVPRKLPDPVETRMRELFDTELNVADEPFTPERLAEALGRAEALVPT